MSHFDITFNDSSRIEGEYREGREVVVFSHGFDVRRDSNGLFHDIANRLPDDIGYVIFDYHAYEGAFESLRPLSEQASVLSHVVTWIKSQLKPTQIHLVAHSMGCTVASYAAELSFTNIIYLAPPIHSGRGLRKFFTTHPGLVHVNEDGYIIERRSGKTSKVTEKFLAEFESAQPAAYLRAYARNRPITIIAAEQDRHIPPSIYHELHGDKQIAVRVLPGDHNFSGDARQLLTQVVTSALHPQKR